MPDRLINEFGERKMPGRGVRFTAFLPGLESAYQTLEFVKREILLSVGEHFGWVGVRVATDALRGFRLRSTVYNYCGIDCCNRT